MPTPISSANAYCSVAEFLKRYDWRTIAQLMSDDDTTPTERTTLTDSTTNEGTRLADILKDASGQVEMAAFAGGRYAPADLEALTGNQSAFLKRLVANIAVGMCYQRRPDLYAALPVQAQEAANILNALAGGEMIFGLQENIDASHMDMTLDKPDDVDRRKLMTNITKSFFGRRGNEYPVRR
jgi:hypothetical protein